MGVNRSKQELAGVSGRYLLGTGLGRGEHSSVNSCAFRRSLPLTPNNYRISQNETFSPSATPLPEGLFGSEGLPPSEGFEAFEGFEVLSPPVEPPP